MPNRVRWRLEGGYSELLDRSRLGVVLSLGPGSLDLEASPFGLSRRPSEIVLSVSKGFRATGPAGLRWRLKPGGKIRALILQPGNAYLGNYRVPGDQYAIQWDVEGEVTSSLSRRFPRFLLSAESGSTLVQRWTKVLPRDLRLDEGLHEAWKSYPDPFDSAAVAAMVDRQVVHWRWRGMLSSKLAVDWSLGTGWQVAASKTLLKLAGSLRSRVRLRADLSVIQRGSFVLRVSKRRGRIQLSVKRESERTRKGGFSVRATLGSRAELEPKWKAVEPLLKPLNRKVAEAVARRTEIALTASAEKWRSSRALLKGIWKKPGSAFAKEYEALIEGRLPLSRPGLVLSGHLESVQGRRLELQLNLLNWIRLGQASERRKFFKVEITPGGDLIVEEGEVREKTRYRWDEVQFISLLYSQVGSVASDSYFSWTFRQKRRFSHKELVSLLKAALHLSSISSFDLPSPGSFPLELEMTWLTRFSPEAIQTIQGRSRKSTWDGLVRALELAESERYTKGSFRRDWFFSKEVRRIIEVNPAQAHLASIYPIRGRSSFERRQVVTAYLRARRFLQLVEYWRADEPERILDSLSLGWDIPVFVWFHLLCPASKRNSVVVIRGDLERVWGDSSLIGPGIGWEIQGPGPFASG